MSIVKYCVVITLLSPPMVLSAQKPPKSGATLPNPAIAYEARGRNQYHDLMVMDADGKNQTRLVSGGDNMAPSWSPDGEWIAFGRTYVASPGIYMIRRNGTGLCLVVPTRSLTFAAPSWSPRPAATGRHKIVYVDQAAGESRTDLFATDAVCGASQPQNLTNTPTVEEYWPAWSTNDVLAASVWEPGFNDGHLRLFDIQLDGIGDVTLIAGADLTAVGPLANGGVWGPVWTPDGTQLIVSGSDDRFSGPDLWVVSASTPGDATKLTDTPDLYEGRATWSPDYAQLAFDTGKAVYRAAADVSGGLWSLSEQTTLVSAKAGSAGVARPSWRPVR